MSWAAHEVEAYFFQKHNGWKVSYLAVVVVPQLMFNLENLGGIGNKAQLTFQYQHWNNGSDYEDERPVPQLMVHWSF